MALRFAFVLLLSVYSFNFGSAIPAFPVDQCGPNAEFKTCGSACVPDCANPEPPTLCTLQCVQGCFCMEGFMKNANGECVRPQNCEASLHNIPMQLPHAAPKCPNNEVFNPCGSACAPTCANPNPSPVCTKNCVIGCFCKEGMLRNAHGVCVATRECDAAQPNMLFAYPPEVSQCKENEIFMPCGSACAPTCAKPHPSDVCTKNCVVGCFCKPGYLKNEHGVCVESMNCGVRPEDAVAMPAPVCGDNEEYRQCKGCDGTCKNPNPLCPRICIPGCACKQGHLRSETGKCIETRQCTAQAQPESFMMLPPVPKCPANEFFMPCGTACPATCAKPHPSPVCTRNCVIGCFCKEGFLRNDQGVCVPAANCAAPANMILAAVEGKCATDREMYTECGNQVDCLNSCGAPLPFLIHGYPQVPPKCLERSCTPGCVCMSPYVRNSNGMCVERSECEHKNPFATTPSH